MAEEYPELRIIASALAGEMTIVDADTYQRFVQSGEGP
jgi:hypothetical protein